MMLMDTMTVMAYVIGIVVIYVFCLIFSKPVKLFARLMINIAFGAVMIFVFNLAGGLLGIKLGLNIFTSSAAGILGIPGIILLFGLKAFL